MRYFKLEIIKALKSPRFLLALGVMLICALISNFYELDVIRNAIELNQHKLAEGNAQNINTVMYSVYRGWIGSEIFTLGYSIYYYAFPLLVCIPFAASMRKERDCGFSNQMISRIGKKKYIWVKYSVAFLTGGLVMTIPLIINFLICCTYMNFAMPDVLQFMYFGVWEPTMGSELFYSHPLVFVVMYWVIDFVMCGLIACMAMGISQWIKKELLIVSIPFVLCILLDYLDTKIVTFYSISILNNVHAVAFPKYCSFWYILISMGIIAGITLVLTLTKGRMKDVI